MKRKEMDRRQFIERTGLGILAAGAGFSVLSAGCSSGGGAAGAVKRTLGRTKLQVPVVSFGVMNSESDALIRAAIDAGVEHLDTAHVYLNGRSEKVIGKVLKESNLRDKVTIATKMRFARDREKNVFMTEGASFEPYATQENFDKQLARSMERLQTDVVDLLYLHSCYSPEMATFEPMLNALVKAKESGKIRFIGVSTHRNVPEVMRAAVDTGVVDVLQIAINFLDNRKDEIRAACQYAADSDVGIVAMKVMGGNRLNEGDSVTINHKAALKWVLSDENVTTTIPGMTTFEQLELNMSVMEDLTLTEDEKRELKVASLLDGNLYCQNCRSCVETCAHRVEIPNLMRAYMYAEGYGNAYQARRTVAELPAASGIRVCRTCNGCTSVCPNGIRIGARIRSLMNGGYSDCALA